MVTNNPYYYSFTYTTFEYNFLRFSTTSLLEPWAQYRFELTTRQLVIETNYTVSAYEQSNYEEKIIFVPATDGEQIPVFLAYKSSLRNATFGNPMLLNGYGKY